MPGSGHWTLGRWLETPAMIKCTLGQQNKWTRRARWCAPLLASAQSPAAY